MNEFFKDKALPLMIPWKPDIDLTEINDDRAGRVLDAIWNSDPQKIFTTVANAAIRVHKLETDIIHSDTTSKSFEGAYENQDPDGITPFITHGFNKDHRPDLKQILLGIGTTADGIPIMGEVADGNESDKIFNGRWIKNFRTVLNKDADEFLLNVADSALVTTDNLNLLADEYMDLISRLPGTFNIEGELKRKAVENEKWEFIGKLSDEKKSATYLGWNTTGEIDGRTYRFVVIQSDNKNKRKLKSLAKSIRKENKKVGKELKEFGKRPFKCKPDAEIEIEKFTKENGVKYHKIDWEVNEKEEKVKKSKRGRLKKGEKIQYKKNYYLKGKLSLDKEIYENECKLCGLFVIITSLMDINEYSAKAILERYKGQGNVERIFKFIKNPAWIGAFCLKKPERLAALGYILLMAAIIYTIWERRVRKELAKENVLPIEGLNKRKTKKPTSYALQKVLSSILVLSERIGNEWYIWLPRPLELNQKRVLELSGFNEKIYSFGRPSV